MNIGKGAGGDEGRGEVRHPPRESSRAGEEPPPSPPPPSPPCFRTKKWFRVVWPRGATAQGSESGGFWFQFRFGHHPCPSGKGYPNFQCEKSDLVKLYYIPPTHTHHHHHHHHHHQTLTTPSPQKKKREKNEIFIFNLGFLTGDEAAVRKWQR